MDFVKSKIESKFEDLFLIIGGGVFFSSEDYQDLAKK